LEGRGTGCEVRRYLGLREWEKERIPDRFCEKPEGEAKKMGKEKRDSIKKRVKSGQGAGE